MKNYELVTVSKGTIKTVDSFIKNFNAIGANMKALSVSAYKFLTDENKDTRIEFQKRVYDELNMSKTTLSFLKTAGWLYMLDERFGEFAYTNVIFFKKVIENYYEETETSISRMFEDLAKFHNQYIDDEYVESLIELSQKELKHLIDEFIKSKEVTEEETEETSEEETEEEQAHFYSIIDEDYDIIMDYLYSINDKMSKLEIMERIAKVKDMLERLS